jgi:hypothetical protein
MIPHGPLQGLNHLAAADPLADLNRQAFTSLIVHHRQKPDPTPIEELVRHKSMLQHSFFTEATGRGSRFKQARRRSCQWASKSVPVLGKQKCTTRRRGTLLRGNGGHDFPSFFGIRLAEAVIFESIAVALDVDHPRMVEKPVEDRRGDDRVAEELLPIAEALVRGQDRRAFLVPVRDELEEQIGLPAVDGQIPGLVDDDETGAVIRLALALGFLELADQRLHGREVDPDAVAAGLDRQGGGQMGLADSWRISDIMPIYLMS